MQPQKRDLALFIIKKKFSHYFSKDELHAMNFWFMDALDHSPESNWENLTTFWLESLLNHKPIQYVFNRAFFGTLDLYVNENTLIPRPETEELCQLILDHPRNQSTTKHQVLDIGTGSGCIPIWLKYNRKEWQISAIDISKEALSVAQKNAEKYKTQIDLQQIDILTLDRVKEDYSIIISNPPYIPEKEKNRLNKNVTNFEPHLALYVEDNDPLIFYKKIANLFEYKTSVEQIWLEIDPETAEINCAIFNKIGVAQIINDYSGNPRFILCERKKEN